MRVAPRPEPGAAYITVGHVDAARKPHLTVHHDDFAVVPVVELAGEPRKGHRHEAVHPNPRSTQPACMAALHAPASHIVVYQPHLHALPCLLRQKFGQAAADVVVFKNIIFEMDGGSRIANRLEQLPELGLPVVQYLHPVAHGKQRLVVVEQKRNDVLVRFDRFDVLDFRVHQLAQLYPAQAAYLLDIVYLFTVEYFLLPIIAPEHHIEDDAGYRKQRNHQNPRQGLYRVAQVMDDDDDRGGDNHEIQYHDCAPDFGHRYYRREQSCHNPIVHELANIAIPLLNPAAGHAANTVPLHSTSAHAALKRTAGPFLIGRPPGRRTKRRMPHVQSDTSRCRNYPAADSLAAPCVRSAFRNKRDRICFFGLIA